MLWLLLPEGSRDKEVAVPFTVTGAPGGRVLMDDRVARTATQVPAQWGGQRADRVAGPVPGGVGSGAGGRPGPIAGSPQAGSSASSATPVMRCRGYVRTSSAVWSYAVTNPPSTRTGAMTRWLAAPSALT